MLCLKKFVRCCALCCLLGEPQCFKMLRQIYILFNSFPNVFVCIPCTPMNILWKSVLHRYQFGKYCTLCKGKERACQMPSWNSDTYVLSIFLVSRSSNFIKRENELGLAWIVITNPCWLQIDRLIFFLNSFLAQNQHRTLSLINETHPVPRFIFKVC